MADTSQMERMLPVREVARLLYVHRNTVRRWSDKGIIRAYRINHRSDRRFSQEDILNFVGTQSKPRESDKG